MRIGCIMNRSEASSQRAVEKTGAGKPVGCLEEMQPAEFWLIGTNDDQVEHVARAMASLRDSRWKGRWFFTWPAVSAWRCWNL